MEADLSQSVKAALDKGLERAGHLEAEGDLAGAAAVYEKCARLAQRYAGYALLSTERERRLRRAEDFLQRSRELAKGETRKRPQPGTSATTAPAEENEYRAAAEALIDRSEISWDEIAGLEDVKRQVRVAFGLAMAARPEGLDIPSGGNILLYGPPGTGKTLLAAATSNQMQGTFFNVKTSGVLSKYFGESSRLVGAIYELARERSPSVVFFDEFDALARSRDSGDSGGAERRLLAEVLAQVDGVQSAGQNSMVLTMGATNEPWALDSAVISRFENRIYVPLPDDEVRRGIVRIHTEARGFALDACLQQVVRRTAGLSGRRIAQVCTKAVRHMLEEVNPELGSAADDNYVLKHRSLTLADFEPALATARPETTPGALERFQKWQETYGE